MMPWPQTSFFSMVPFCLLILKFFSTRSFPRVGNIVLPFLRRYNLYDNKFECLSKFLIFYYVSLLLVATSNLLFSIAHLSFEIPIIFDCLCPFNGIFNMDFGLDLLIVDILESLYVLHLFVSITSVHNWNILQPRFLDKAFDFDSFHVQNLGDFYYFHIDDVKIKTNMKEFMKAYNFTVFRSLESGWASINCK